MKKFLPYVFPLIAIALVVLLLFRWYQTNDVRDGQISQFGEGIEIENLSSDEASNLSGVGDYESVEMSSENDQALGTIRYEIANDKITFSVIATLPELEAGQYQVWLKEVNGDAVRPAFSLEMAKGGYMGSAAVSTDLLPFEVIVSQEMQSDNTVENVLLRAVLEAEAPADEAASTN